MHRSFSWTIDFHFDVNCLFFFSCITMYPNESTNKFCREIPLEHVILQLNTDDDRDHCFEIRTDQNSYYCGCKRTQSRVRF